MKPARYASIFLALLRVPLCAILTVNAKGIATRQAARTDAIEMLGPLCATRLDESSTIHGPDGVTGVVQEYTGGRQRLAEIKLVTVAMTDQVLEPVGCVV